MNPRLLPSLLLLAASALTLAAQSASNTTTRATESSFEEQRRAFTFTVDFPGGTLAHLNDSIARSGGPVFNLVGEKADLAAEIPAISLRNVEPESLANALNRLVGPRGLEITRAQGPLLHGGINQSIYVVAKKLAPRQATLFDSFQLGAVLEKQSIDDIVAAIRLAWELNPQHAPDALQLKFHPPTKLLLASGSPDAIMVASKVINNLPKPRSETAAEAERLQAVAEETAKRADERRKISESFEKARDAKSAPPAAEKK